MSAEEVRSVLERSMDDLGFAEAFKTDPEAAIAPYDLTEEEEAALVGRESEKIRDVLGDYSFNIGLVVLPW